MFPAQFRVKFVLNCTRSVTQFLSVDCCVCILDISCTCGMTDTTLVMCYAQVEERVHAGALNDHSL